MDRNLYYRGLFKLYISRPSDKIRRKTKRREKNTEEDEELTLKVGDKALFGLRGICDYLATLLLVEHNDSLTYSLTNGTAAPSAVTTSTQQYDDRSYNYLSAESSIN